MANTWEVYILFIIIIAFKKIFYLEVYFDLSFIRYACVSVQPFSLSIFIPMHFSPC